MLPSSQDWGLPYSGNWIGSVEGLTCQLHIYMKKWSEVKSLSRVRLFATPWTVAHQAPLSIEFFRQEYWSGLPFLPPGDIPDPGIEPGSPSLQADAFTVWAMEVLSKQ